MRIMKKTRKWKYKNTTLLVLSLVVLFFISDTEVVHTLIKQVGSYGYLGGAITGVFLVSTFTFAPASVVLFHLAQDFNPILLALCAGAGAACGDLLIFRFLKDHVFEELTPLFGRFKKSYVVTILKRPYVARLLPVIGAIIIASPLPDEIGVGLMGLSKIRFWHFILLTFALNTIGVLVFVSVATIL